MVQPDAYGLGLAQSRALAELSSSARTQAQGEQQQAFEQAFKVLELMKLKNNNKLEFTWWVSRFIGALVVLLNLNKLVNQGLSIEAC